MNLYTDNDPYVCAWLRNLADAGHIPPGTVLEKDINDVSATDLLGHIQHHYFCGVAGWPLALRLAGWPDDQPVTTASLPCQPWSSAGKQAGENDERHLWPVFARIISESKTPVIFGEQVPGAIPLGWLDGVFASLEGQGYACGAMVLPAASKGAPHIRARIFWGAVWLADVQEHGRRQRPAEPGGSPCGVPPQGHGSGPAHGGESRGVEHATITGLPRRTSGDGSGEERCGHDGWRRQPHDPGNSLGLGHADSAGQRQRQERDSTADHDGAVSRGSDARGSGGRVATDGVGDTLSDGRQGRQPSESGQTGWTPASAGVPDSPWSDYRIIPCRDGKYRRIESGIQCLAPGLPRQLGPLEPILAELGHSSKDARRLLREAKRNRIGRLKAYGNAVVPQVAAIFIRAFMEAIEEGISCA